jgi:hypothetical protein
MNITWSEDLARRTSVSFMAEMGSNLSQETSYLDWKFSRFSAGKCRIMR